MTSFSPAPTNPPPLLPAAAVTEILMAAIGKLSHALFLSTSLFGRVPSWNTIFKLIFVLLAFVNIKSLPLTWHFRFYRSLFLHTLRRRNSPPSPFHLFSPISTTSRSPLYECDFNMHKSNSTYFSDLDIARTHLVCHLIKRSLSIRRKSKKPLYVALAGVAALFRREIKPFERYEVVSRVLGWDGKWFWVVNHFVALGKVEAGGKRKIFASALSKYVFKQGRITVPPEEVLRESGLLPERPAGAEELTPGTSGSCSPRDGELVEISTAAIAAVNGGDDPLMKDLDRSLAQSGKTDDSKEYWTWDRIEAERKRGCDLAKYMLGLDGLDLEIRNGKEEGLEHIGKWF